MSLFSPEDESVERDLGPVKSEYVLGVQGLSFTQNVSGLKEVRRLDYLIQAHTLLAIMEDKTSPEHQLNLLRAYTFVLQIWQVVHLQLHCSWQLWQRLQMQIGLKLSAVCAMTCAPYFTTGFYGSSVWDFQGDGKEWGTPTSCLCWIQKRQRQGQRQKSQTGKFLIFVPLLALKFNSVTWLNVKLCQLCPSTLPVWFHVSQVTCWLHTGVKNKKLIGL